MDEKKEAEGLPIARLPFPLYRYLPDLDNFLANAVKALEAQGLRAVRLWDIEYTGSTLETFSLRLTPADEAPDGIPGNALVVGFPADGEAVGRPVAIYEALGTYDEETRELAEKMAAGDQIDVILSRIIRRGGGEGVDTEVLVAATPELLTPRKVWEELILSAQEDDDLAMREVEDGLIIAAFPSEDDKERSADAQEQVLSMLKEKIRGKPFVFRLIDPLPSSSEIKIPDDLRAWSISPVARAAVLKGEVLTLGIIDVERYIDQYLWVFQEAGASLNNVDIGALADSMSAIVPIQGRQLRAFFTRAILSIAYEGHALKEEALLKGRADLESVLS